MKQELSAEEKRLHYKKGTVFYHICFTLAEDRGGVQMASHSTE